MFEKLKQIPIGTDLADILDSFVDIFETEEPESANDFHKTYFFSAYMGILSGCWENGVLVHNENTPYSKFDSVSVKDYGSAHIMPHDEEELDEELKSFTINSTMVDLDKTYVRVIAGDLCWVLEVELSKEPVIVVSDDEPEVDEINYGLGFGFGGGFFGNGGGLPN